MLLSLVVGVCFVICLMAWYFWDGITRVEAIALFVALSIAFYLESNYIYKKTTTDQYYVSGYVTSLIFRPPGTKVTPTWIIEQSSYPPMRHVKITRPIDKNDDEIMEECEGECLVQFRDNPN